MSDRSFVVEPAPRRPTRFSGNSKDRDFWRIRSKTPPIVILDGKVCDKNIVEAFSGDYGYVRVEVVDAEGKPILASVVLPDGEIIDQIIAHRTIYGDVTIIWPEPTE
ncbi:hypothetical protein [Mesorhizobium sp.]|uniref:hypothetical protein n=1 Tax=Mesorhizobium sp. TaxID=1871066 RepID=UPI000FEAB2A9|nr:hypothetical protein [Mesorhizobium sp.]RWB50855.1 MAG: hypothetical protein EOQ47_31895 [Mesorhizobium sp.]